MGAGGAGGAGAAGGGAPGGGCNAFALCRFLRLLGNLMVAVVFALFFLSWVPLVVGSYGPAVVQPTSAGSAVVALLVLVLFHFCGFMMLWSYCRCVATDPGRVPSGWLPDAVPPELAGGPPPAGFLERFDRSDPARPRWCRKCSAWKPERAHHCSVCGRCVLRMDHHCVWVVNCVGEKNYKYFLLFIFWAFWTCGVAAAALLPLIVDFFNNGDMGPGGDLASAFMAFVMDLALFLSLLGFQALHLRLLLQNCTTIEAFEKRNIQPWPYDKGRRGNFVEVFGHNPWLWAFPVPSGAATASLASQL